MPVAEDRPGHAGRLLERYARLCNGVLDRSVVHLNGPASSEALEDWRRQFGDRFPDSLIELYSVADGEVRKPFSYVFSDAFTFISVERAVGLNVSNERAARLWEMADRIDSKSELLKSNPGFSKAWIPFSICGSDSLAVDTDPSDRGRYGQVVRVTHSVGIVQDVVAPSLGALLQQQIDMVQRYEFHVVDHEGNRLGSPAEVAEYFREVPDDEAEVYVQPEAGADASAFRKD